MYNNCFVVWGNEEREWALGTKGNNYLIRKGPPSESCSGGRTEKSRWILRAEPRNP